MLFQKRLKALRKTKIVSQLAVAEAIGITDRGYRKYEAGDSEPTLSVMVRLADYFDVSLDYLTGRTDNPDSHKG